MRHKCIAVPWISTIAMITLMPLGSVVSAQEKTVIKHVPAVASDPSSGQQMFQAYCASCHGTDAKGNGPAAPALRKTPSDLTQLTKNAGGKFPELRVYDVIRGDTALPAHGSSGMPVWGRVFRSLSGSDLMMHHRLSVLTRYIQSLQR